MADQHRVIFDTDIGTDVDDILALAFLLGSPEVRIEGVTTVYGDVGLRARMVRKLLQLRDIDGIPVHTGVGRPLLGLDPVYWPGHEGVGLLDESDDLPAPSETHAVDFLVGHVLANPGQITLLAVGPLTNVATAIVREPRFAKALRRLVIMGGRIDVTDTTSGPAEHNIKCDPEAAHVVFSSGAPIELVPLDVTLRAVIRQPGVDALMRKGTPYHNALADQVARYPGFVSRGGSTFLHDPLAAMAVVRPDHLGWTPYHLGIELRGTLTRAMTVARLPDDRHPTTARVAMELDVAACETLIAARLAS
jgi:purine nucleosidase